MKVTVPPENLEAIAGLEPASLWAHFATISSIPRPSKHEQAVLQYIKDFADGKQLKWNEDAAGNLVVFHPGCGMGKEAPAVILQGHVDMVTEKTSDCRIDFYKDPILLRRLPPEPNGGDNWMRARGTTLGADDGIGVAAALALLETPLDSTQPMPPLEAVFTVDEELDLTGALELDAKALGLTGKTMLNLDSEEWGDITVGSAGIGITTIQYALAREPQEDHRHQQKLVEIRVEGLKGGHSGCDIHQGRANAIQLCAGLTLDVLEQLGAGLISLTAPGKDNVIPREAKALLAIPDDNVRAKLETVVKQFKTAAQAEYGIFETTMNLSVVEVNTDDHVKSPLTQDCASRLLSILLALPHGPLKFSHAIADLVETSINLGSLTLSDDNDTALILCSVRSSIDTALISARNRLVAVAHLAGATYTHAEPFPGWSPNTQSPLLQLAKKLLSNRLPGGAEPGIKAVHAGLECGLLIEKLGGNVDAISIGPTIIGAHTPDEKLHMDTVEPFWEFLKDLMVELAKERKE